MQLNCGYLTIEFYSINLICHLYITVWWQIRQWSHLADESWTARCAVIRWRQPTT